MSSLQGKMATSSFKVLFLLIALCSSASAQRTAVTSARWIPGTLEIHHIYVGQGDSVLVISPTGKTLLYDLGERDWPLHENADLVAAYVEQVTGKKELDYFVISHYHQDHVGNSKVTESGARYEGGMFRLFKSRALKIHKVIDRGFEPIVPRVPIALKYKEFVESPEGRKLVNRETARLGRGQIDLGEPIVVDVVAVNGKTIIDGREVQVLPEAELKADPPPSENDFSVCLKITWNDFEYFIGGDLSGEDYVSQYGYKYHDIETRVAEAVGNVEVYRVSHHGSDHSSNPKFVEVLDPEVSVVSAGTANRFGHPRQSVIDRLLETGDLFITAREGGASSPQFKRSVEGGTVVIRVFNSGYNYEVSITRSYRSYSDEQEARHLDQQLDYEQQQVRYEEAQGRRPPDEEEDGSKSGDVKAQPEGNNNVQVTDGEATTKNGFPRIRVKDRARLEQYIGKKVYVWGKVTSTFTPASNKVKFLNIDTENLEESFTVVIFNKDWPNFYETPGIGDPCKFYANKWIEVGGIVTRYEPRSPNEQKSNEKSKKLNITVSAPHQIEVLPFRQGK
ncbi:MAG: hypothetical protein RMM17_10240 [Acidobacteriota bacterium]|nr:hypothetical protein [Blastocatellia bacterium]MDW8413048.1 hypothetical protein [Acidobacteriota bacterium]